MASMFWRITVVLSMLASTSLAFSLYQSPPDFEDLLETDVPPPPPSSVTATKIIESFHVKSDIRFRFATTQMVSVVRNIANYSQEVFFDVVLPKEAFIVSFSMEIDGKVYDGEVKEKAEAKKDYLSAVQKGESAGHVRQAPRHSNIFEVSVNVANGSAVTFTLTYQEMLKRKLGVYEHDIHINPGQAVEDFSVEVYIQENKPLTFVKTPALRTDSLLTNEIESDNTLTVVDRRTPESAHILYKPSLKDQGEKGVSAQFIVQYDVEHSAKGDVMVVDGYFIHFFAPDLPAMPKDIVFVLDVSGSMYGKKMEQLKEAMATILKDLQPQDRFNIITFSSQIDYWKSALVAAKGEVMQEARDFVKSMTPDGMTNINGALLAGIAALKKQASKERVAMIFFLTDGIPTEGEQNPNKIAANIRNNNENFAAIFCLSFGNGADYDSLKTLGAQNSGFARKIYEASDAALQVSSFYKEISAVVMKDITIHYLPSAVDEYSITDNEFPVVFNGSEIIICGRMADKVDTFSADITGLQMSGSVEIVLEVDNINEVILSPDDTINKFFTVPRDYAGIVEKMWAYTTIKQMLRDKERHVSNETRVNELEDKILQMSLKYKFVTPLTSMVVTKPETDDKPVESGLKDSDDLNFDHIPFAQGHKRMAMPRNFGSYGPVAVKYYNNPFLSHPPNFLAGKPNIHLHQQPRIPHATYAPAVATSSKSVRTMPTTVLTRQQKPKNPNKQKQSKTINNGSRLVSILVTSGTRKICVAPREVNDGTYVLAESSNGTRVTVTAACNQRQCYTKLFQQMTIVSGSDVGIVNLNQTSPTEWSYNLSPGMLATTADDGLVFGSVGGIQTTVKWIPRYRGSYLLTIQLDPKQTYSGMMGDLLKLPSRKVKKYQKKKIPKVCQGMNADFSLTMSKKLTAKHRL